MVCSNSKSTDLCVLIMNASLWPFTVKRILISRLSALLRLLSVFLVMLESWCG